jgi:pilus assembly protein CpaC
MEEQGLVRRLAEPNLIAMSGETADFLAGGEFPVPVSSTTTGGFPTVTIQYKEFGVSLAFTPTVLAGGVINLRVRPEVSDLDYNLTVQTAGVTVPGIVKRRANTTLELRDGQSFAIAGLIQAQNGRTVDQVPWLGSVPIIGTLFKSQSFQQRDTELVVIVTPHLVKPSKPGQPLESPLDTRMKANDLDAFGANQLDVRRPGAPGATPLQNYIAVNGSARGAYGHMVRSTAQGAR